MSTPNSNSELTTTSPTKWLYSYRPPYPAADGTVALAPGTRATITEQLVELEGLLTGVAATKCNGCGCILLQHVSVVRHVQAWLSNPDVYENGSTGEKKPRDLIDVLCPNVRCNEITMLLDQRYISSKVDYGIYVGIWMLLLFFESDERIGAPTTERQEPAAAFNSIADALRRSDEEDEKHATIMNLITLILEPRLHNQSRTRQTETWERLTHLVIRYSGIPAFLLELITTKMAAKALSKRPKLYEAAFKLIHVLYTFGACQNLVVGMQQAKNPNWSLHQLCIEGEKAMHFGRLTFSLKPALIDKLGWVPDMANSLAEMPNPGEEVTTLIKTMQILSSSLRLHLSAPVLPARKNESPAKRRKTSEN